MANIVTRAGKGSPLTHAEMDANLTNLNTDKLEVSVHNTHVSDLASTASGKGAAMIGWIASGVGAVAKTVAKWLGYRRASVFDYMTDAQIADVQAGTLLIDVTTPVANALAAHLDPEFPAGNYKLSAELTIRTGHRLVTHSATLTQVTSNTPIFRINTKDDITIRGFKFVGVGTDFTDSPSSLAVAIRGTTVKRALITENQFNGFSCAGVFLDFSEDCIVTDNVIVGPGEPTLTPVTSGACYGVVVDGSRFLVAGNTISQTAQGVATGDGTVSVKICDNTIFNIIGQHGIYAGSGLINLVITGNNIASTGLIGIKVQNYDTPALHADNIVVADNAVSSTGSHGIAVLSTAPGTPTYKLRNVSVTGNTVRSAGEDAFNFSDIEIGAVTGNTAYAVTRDGMAISRLNGVSIKGNTIREATKNGIRESAACTGCEISSNSIQNCSSALTVGEKNGILIQLGDTFVIDNNVITDSNSKMQYGIFISGGTQTGMAVRNNICRGMTDYGARFKSPAEGLLVYTDNYFSGTTGPVLNDPTIPSVASASTITLPVGKKLVRITGTATIDVINTSGHVDNQPVTLLFDSTATVTRNGSNILIAASFVATASDTLTIATDGTLWYEVARAVN